VNKSIDYLREARREAPAMVDRARVSRDPFRYGRTSAKRERHTAQFSLVSEARTQQICNPSLEALTNSRLVVPNTTIGLRS
jgi:hypothetical protein